MLQTVGVCVVACMIAHGLLGLPPNCCDVALSNVQRAWGHGSARCKRAALVDQGEMSSCVGLLHHDVQVNMAINAMPVRVGALFTSVFMHDATSVLFFIRPGVWNAETTFASTALRKKSRASHGESTPPAIGMCTRSRG